jgi:DNA-binding transcriptional MocR family regulator
MSVAVQKYITGRSSVEIASSIEAAIREERLAPADPLPTIRSTARALRVSPATVAAAYRALRERGLLVTRGRRGTAVTARPPLPTRVPAALPAHVRNLADGNPDRALLPDLGPALARIDAQAHLYGESVSHAPLLRAAARQLQADGIPADHLTVVSGALDGLERVLAVHLRRGDHVAVEDPAFIGVLDLLQVLGLVPVPVAIDDSGPRPDALRAALKSGAAALIVTPRAQNPTGAALDEPRVRALRRVLREFPDVLLLEDDHAGPVAGTLARTLCDATRARWAVARSVSKSLGPDLRLAILVGDATTIARVEGRTLIGMRWVSHLLQRLVTALWSERGMPGRLRKAERTYTQRRDALIRSLASHGIVAHGRSGMNVWVPVPEEAPVVTHLLEAGWAVSAGERFRLESPPAVRICIASLPVEDAPRLAADLARVLAPEPRTRVV